MKRHALQMTLSELIEPHRLTLRRTFLFGLIVVAAVLIWTAQVTNPALVLIACVIAALAVIPSYLWVSGKVTGFPIAPAIGISEIILFTMPIIGGAQAIAIYTDVQILRAGITEVLFLGSFILAWFFVARKCGGELPDRILALPLNRVGRQVLDRMWLIGLLASTIYVVIYTAGLYDVLLRFLPAGARGIIRAVLLTLGVASGFFLGMSLGQRTLRSFGAVLFLALVLLHCLAMGISLLLVSVVPLLFATLAGFIIGRGKIPWITLLLIAISFHVLHLGKLPMRLDHWQTGRIGTAAMAPTQYPDFYARWFREGIHIQRYGVDHDVGEIDDLLERASLIQMLLYAQVRAPESVEFLNGRTIAIIPPLLVPRVLWPNKPSAHEGQILLNTHFGRQTVEEAQRTFIAWGMLAEFYANFGTKGAVIGGLLFGALVGWVTGFSAGAPLGSYRAVIAAVFFLSSITATQMALSTWITATFQALVAATLLCLIIMRPISLHEIMDDSEEEAEP